MHFKSSWRLKAGPIQILVNRCVKKRGGVIGFIVVGVYDTVCRGLRCVGWEYSEDVMALFDGECIFSPVFKFEGRAV